MLGQPVSMLIPEVVGFKLTGKLPEGATATDLVLTVTKMLRKKGVVGKFVEFYGPGLDNLPLADRATIGNMAPEYGATCGFFPIDQVTLDYLRLTGRDPQRVALVEAYAKAQGMWRQTGCARPGLHRHARARPRHGRAVAGRPQAAAGPGGASGRAKAASRKPCPALPATPASTTPQPVARRRLQPEPRRRGHRRDHQLHQHLEPGRDARRRPRGQEGGREGPQAQAVGEDLAGAGLQGGHRLSTGRPGWSSTSSRSASTWSATAARPASATPARCRSRIADAVTEGQLVVGCRALRQPQLRGPRPPAGQGQLPGLAAAGRGLRPRRHADQGPDHRAAGRGQRRPAGLSEGHLADPAGGRRDRPLGGQRARCSRAPTPTSSRATSAGPGSGIDASEHDLRLGRCQHLRAACRPTSRACRASRSANVADIKGARVLALLGDSITTDHISPAGNIAKTSPAAKYLSGRRGRAQGLQLLRRPPRQPRGDDARHLRQHPHQERDAGRQGGRR